MIRGRVLLLRDLLRERDHRFLLGPQQFAGVVNMPIERFHSRIGVGLFRTTLGEDVVEYISNKIHNLPHELEQHKKANSKQMSLERIRQKETTWLRKGEQAKLTAENIQMRAYLQRAVQIKKRQRGGYGML